MMSITNDSRHHVPQNAVLEKHPMQSDSSLAELLYIQIKGTAPEMTRPLLLKVQVYDVKCLAHAERFPLW